MGGHVDLHPFPAENRSLNDAELSAFVERWCSGHLACFRDRCPDGRPSRSKHRTNKSSERSNAIVPNI